MSYTVYVRHAAERDAAEAQDWYASQTPGLGKRFNDAFGQALMQLEQMPLVGPRVYGEVRRVVLRPFPYLLWYRVEGSDVIVLACTHGKRSQDVIHSKLR